MTNYHNINGLLNWIENRSKERNVGLRMRKTVQPRLLAARGSGFSWVYALPGPFFTCFPFAAAMEDRILRPRPASLALSKNSCALSPGDFYGRWIYSACATTAFLRKTVPLKLIVPLSLLRILLYKKARWRETGRMNERDLSYPIVPGHVRISPLARLLKSCLPA